MEDHTNRRVVVVEDKENELPQQAGKAFYTNNDGDRWLRDKEQISNLRKQVALRSSGELHRDDTPPQASEADATNTNQRLRRMSHLGRRTATPLRELFQQTLAAAATSAPDGKNASYCQQPPLAPVSAGRQPPGPKLGSSQDAAELPYLRVTGKRKSDADTVLERLALSEEGAAGSPGKRRRTSSLLPFAGGASVITACPTTCPQSSAVPVANSGSPTCHSHTSSDQADEVHERGEEASEDDKLQEIHTPDSRASATTTAPEDAVLMGPAMRTLLEPCSASPSGNSVVSVDARVDKRSSFLRRTFSMKKLKSGGTFTATKDPRLSLLRLLADHDLAVAVALLETGDEDAAKSVLTLFDGTGQALHLLKSFLGRELRATVSEGTLFRGVSVGTRLVSHYLRLHGREYLKATLGPFFAHLSTSGIQLEVDPNRALCAATPTTTTVGQDCLALRNLVSVLLDSLFSAPEAVPPALRDLFMYLQMEVLEHFPSMKYKAVGGFFFLRFVCPALVSPEHWELVPTSPSSGLRRTLVLVGKVVQNLANELEFGDKETYMLPMNSFIHDNIPRMKEFLCAISCPPAGGFVPPSTRAGEVNSEMWSNDDFVTSLLDVFDQLSLHLDVLVARLNADGQSILAEELQVVAKESPSARDSQLRVKKRTRDRKKKDDKQARKRRSLSDSELVEDTSGDHSRKTGTPGRRQLNRLLSTSKKLLPKFSADQHPDDQTSSSSISRKFLKARRKASSSTAE